ncbi:MAG: hypothetical protein ACQETE_04145 [Bacteroidota bacterium]
MLILAVLLLALIVLGVARLTGWYQPRQYEAVLHKERIHYVPKNTDLKAPLDEFPTRPPNENEYISAEGRLVEE